MTLQVPRVAPVPGYGSNAPTTGSTLTSASDEMKPSRIHPLTDQVAHGLSSSSCVDDGLRRNAWLQPDPHRFSKEKGNAAAPRSRDSHAPDPDSHRRPEHLRLGANAARG